MSYTVCELVFFYFNLFSFMSYYRCIQMSCKKQDTILSFYIAVVMKVIIISLHFHNPLSVLCQFINRTAASCRLID